MNDSIKMNLYEYLDEHYYDKLEFLKHKNPKKMIIFFSGRSGVGKSTLARYLSKELCAIHLENDKLRVLVQAFFRDSISQKERNQMVWEYGNSVNERLTIESSNRLWIRDAIVDRFYADIWEYCAKNDINRFVISFQLSDEFNDHLIAERGNLQHINVTDLLGGLRQRQLAWRTDFLQHNTPDYIFTDENHGQYEEVLQLIKERYQSL